MDFINRNWVLFEASEFGSIAYNKMCENSSDDLIYNADNSKAFGSFDKPNTPKFLSGKTIYTFEEFVNILNTSW